MNELKKEYNELVNLVIELINPKRIITAKEIDIIWDWHEDKIKEAEEKGFRRGYKICVERAKLNILSDEQT